MGAWSESWLSMASQSSFCMMVLCCCCSLQKERVSVGDVIYIEANSGAVKRVGRCDAYATEFDLEAEEYVPLPKVCSCTSRAPRLLHLRCNAASCHAAGRDVRVVCRPASDCHIKGLRCHESEACTHHTSASVHQLWRTSGFDVCNGIHRARQCVRHQMFDTSQACCCT